MSSYLPDSSDDEDEGEYLSDNSMQEPHHEDNSESSDVDYAGSTSSSSGSSDNASKEKFMLTIRATLNNLLSLEPQVGCDGPDFTYNLQLKCNNCRRPVRERVGVRVEEAAYLKCKYCNKPGTIKMIPGYDGPLTREMSESGDHAPLMVFECRAFEPTGFFFDEGWKAESAEGTMFEYVDLSNGEFLDHDSNGKEVRISALNSSFLVMRE